MKWFALLGLILFLGVAVAPSINADNIKSENIDSNNYDYLMVFAAFIFGKIKEPYYQNDYYFHIENAFICGFFVYGLTAPYFHKQHLKGNWFANDVQYRGFNQFRIINNLTSIDYICGFITSGEVYLVY